VPLPTVPSTIARRVAPYVLTFLQGTTQQIWYLALSAVPIRSVLNYGCTKYITEFDLPANTRRKEMVVSVENQPDLPDRNCAHRAKGCHDLARHFEVLYLWKSDNHCTVLSGISHSGMSFKGFLYYVCL